LERHEFLQDKSTEFSYETVSKMQAIFSERTENQMDKNGNEQAED